FSRTLKHHLDRSVAAVSDPASEFQRSRCILGPSAIADALDKALDADVHGADGAHGIHTLLVAKSISNIRSQPPLSIKSKCAARPSCQRRFLLCHLLVRGPVRRVDGQGFGVKLPTARRLRVRG